MARLEVPIIKYFIRVAVMCKIILHGVYAAFKLQYFLLYSSEEIRRKKGHMKKNKNILLFSKLIFLHYNNFSFGTTRAK